MHRTHFAVCPKCEKFVLLSPTEGPTVYCAHYAEPIIMVSSNPNVSGEIIRVEKILCKVLPIGDQTDEDS